jgi:hypothetical protein
LPLSLMKGLIAERDIVTAFLVFGRSFESGIAPASVLSLKFDPESEVRCIKVRCIKRACVSRVAAKFISPALQRWGGEYKNHGAP